MAKREKIRVLLSKTLVDGHDRGIRYIAQLLRDAGMEVIFTRYYVVDEVVKTAIEEDIDVIALSFYGAGLMWDSQKVMDLMKENGLDDKLMIVGGTIMGEEKDKLYEMGVDGVFQPNVGIPEDIVDFIFSRFSAEDDRKSAVSPN